MPVNGPASDAYSDRTSEAGVLNNLADVLQEVRRFDEEITAHQDAAAICRETGDRHREDTTLGNRPIAFITGSSWMVC